MFKTKKDEKIKIDKCAISISYTKNKQDYMLYTKDQIAAMSHNIFDVTLKTIEEFLYEMRNKNYTKHQTKIIKLMTSSKNLKRDNITYNVQTDDFINNSNSAIGKYIIKEHIKELKKFIGD